MTQLKANVGINRSKDHKLFRETAKHRYSNEKKEMELELHHNKETIEKLINDKYAFYDEAFEHNIHHVVFKKNKEDSYIEITFSFEENYNQLKIMWEEPH
jgi:hypothetical protein